jgi:hypothetical protein
MPRPSSSRISWPEPQLRGGRLLAWVMVSTSSNRGDGRLLAWVMVSTSSNRMGGEVAGLDHGEYEQQQNGGGRSLAWIMVSTSSNK